MRKPSELKEGEEIVLRPIYGSNLRMAFMYEYSQLQCWIYHKDEPETGIEIPGTPGQLDAMYEMMKIQFEEER